MSFHCFYLISNSASHGNVAWQGGGFATYQNDQSEIFLPGAVPSDTAGRLRFYRYWPAGLRRYSSKGDRRLSISR